MITSQNKELAIFEKKVIIPNKALEDSYEVAELIIEKKITYNRWIFNSSSLFENSAYNV